MNQAIARRFFLHACAAAQGAPIPRRKSMVVTASSFPVRVASVPPVAIVRDDDGKRVGRQNDRTQQLAAVERELHTAEQRYVGMASKPGIAKEQLHHLQFMLASLRSMVEQVKTETR